MSPAAVALAASLLLPPAIVLVRLGRREVRRRHVRARIERAERRAFEVASSVGLRARRDSDRKIYGNLATWRLEGTLDEVSVDTSMSLYIPEWGWMPNEDDWMHIELRGRRWLPGDVEVRIARHGSHRWLETADMHASGVPVVIDPNEALRKWPLLRDQVQQLPHRSYPKQVNRERFVVEVRLAPGSDAAAVLRDIVTTALAWAERAEPDAYRA